jgi:hypothetical protein
MKTKCPHLLFLMDEFRCTSRMIGGVYSTFNCIFFDKIEAIFKSIDPHRDRYFRNNRVYSMLLLFSFCIQRGWKAQIRETKPNNIISCLTLFVVVRRSMIIVIILRGPFSICCYLYTSSLLMFTFKKDSIPTSFPISSFSNCSILYLMRCKSLSLKVEQLSLLCAITIIRYSQL